MKDRIEVNGGCHCGAVRFRAEIDRHGEAKACNCSICSMIGFQHLIVPASRFELLSGRENLTEYRFRTGVARHLFCATCGVKSFYVPRSNPDGYSLNVRCLELPPECSLEITEFDGRNWSKNAGALRHLSSE